MDEIERLFNQGDYLGASKLADEYKITDCRNICQNLSGIVDISDAIEHSLTITTTLEDKINGYESEIRNLKEVALQMEEREHAVEVQCKNLEDTCSLIQELIENLHISDQTEKILLESNLDDEGSIGFIEDSLNELDRVLNYKLDPSLVEMKCVRDQRQRANVIKSISKISNLLEKRRLR